MTYKLAKSHLNLHLQKCNLLLFSKNGREAGFFGDLHDFFREETFLEMLVKNKQLNILFILL